MSTHCATWSSPEESRPSVVLEILAAIVDEHTRIIAAIEAGDATRAAARMKDHLVTTARLLLAQEGGANLHLSPTWAELVVD